MKLTTGILVVAIAVGTAGAQNPDVIENTRNTMKAVEQKKEIDQNAALAASQPQTPKSAPTASAPVHSAPAKVTTTASPASSKAQVKPVVKTSSAKAVPAKADSAKAAAKATSTKAASTKAPVVKTTAVKTTAVKTTAAKAHAVKPVHVAVVPEKKDKPAAHKTKAAAAKKESAPAPDVAVQDQKNPDATKDQPKDINLTGRRDPFISPVVNRSMIGSGCSTGKRCLAIDQIALKGVVKSDNGMIAVVVNAVNKAYFLRENDPVFNGYVVKITGDSIIFKETIQDKLGKPFTREVTKKITTPAV